MAHRGSRKIYRADIKTFTETETSRISKNHPLPSCYRFSSFLRRHVPFRNGILPRRTTSPQIPHLSPETASFLVPSHYPSSSFYPHRHSQSTPPTSSSSSSIKILSPPLIQTNEINTCSSPTSKTNPILCSISATPSSPQTPRTGNSAPRSSPVASASPAKYTVPAIATTSSTSPRKLTAAVSL